MLGINHFFLDTVFQNLLNGSYNHLDAFQIALDADGTECPAQLGIGECACPADRECDMTGQGNEGADNRASQGDNDGNRSRDGRT